MTKWYEVWQRFSPRWSFIYCVRKILQKPNISYLLIRTVRNVGFCKILCTHHINDPRQQYFLIFCEKMTERFNPLSASVTLIQKPVNCFYMRATLALNGFPKYFKSDCRSQNPDSFPQIISWASTSSTNNNIRIKTNKTTNQQRQQQIQQ